MKPLLAEIAADLKKCRSNTKKIEILRKNDNPTFREFCAYWVNPNIKWLLPDGEPPYVVNEPHDAEENLWGQVRKLYVFVEGGAPNLAPNRREKLWVDTLEMLHPDDAKMMIAMANGKRKGLNEATVREAFPGLLTY